MGVKSIQERRNSVDFDVMITLKVAGPRGADFAVYISSGAVAWVS